VTNGMAAKREISFNKNASSGERLLMMFTKLGWANCTVCIVDALDKRFI
jgi:hypothetical protein